MLKFNKFFTVIATTTVSLCAMQPASSDNYGEDDNGELHIHTMDLHGNGSDSDSDSPMPALDITVINHPQAAPVDENSGYIADVDYMPLPADSADYREGTDYIKPSAPKKELYSFDPNRDLGR